METHVPRRGRPGRRRGMSGTRGICLFLDRDRRLTGAMRRVTQEGGTSLVPQPTLLGLRAYFLPFFLVVVAASFSSSDLLMVFSICFLSLKTLTMSGMTAVLIVLKFVEKSAVGRVPLV